MVFGIFTIYSNDYYDNFIKIYIIYKYNRKKLYFLTKKYQYDKKVFQNKIKCVKIETIMLIRLRGINL